MPFSASTCLSYLGSSILGSTLKVYTNPISLTNPGTFLMDVSTSSVTGGNCPYNFVVPDGTTTIRLFDPTSFCYCDIPVSDNNVCSTCNLEFATISNNELSTIYVGNLTGSCDTSIDNYRIEWYGPDNPSTLAFTSGKGSIFPHQVTQPITSSSLDAPLLLPGYYVSKITEVELNGVRFSSTGGTNNVLSTGLVYCSTGATVSSFTCSNGIYTYPPYAHSKSYTTDGSSTPQSLSASYTLSANTSHFIWAFQAYSIYDTLTLTFSGSSYSNPIVLENIRLGGDAGGTNFTPTTFPKIYGTSGEYRKIITLTGLTVNNGDSIIINLNPNPTVNATSWNLKFGCYSNPTASKTCLDSYKNSPYKIKKETISSSTNSCGEVTINLSVSGCSTSDNSSFFNSDLATLSSSVYGNYVNTDNTTKLVQVGYGPFYTGRTQVSGGGPGFGINCTNSGTNTISITKSGTTGVDFFFSNLSDLTAYYNSFTAATTTVKNVVTANGTFINDPTTINYYRFITLRFPTNTGNVLCGDSVNYTDREFHCNVSCTTGTTSGGYTMFISTPLLTNNYTCPSICTISCPSCIDSRVNSNNTTRNNTFSTITNTSGLRLLAPFWDTNYCQLQTLSGFSGQTNDGYVRLDIKYSTTTYASSGITNTLIPSLSGVTWDWGNHFNEVSPSSSNPYYQQDLFRYRVAITSFSPLTYQIYATPISNFVAQGTEVLAYDSTSPLSYNPTYVY